MIFRKIIHEQSPASIMCEDVAEFNKDVVSQAQYEVLKYNVYTIEAQDKVMDDYHGCGNGWVEFDRDGKCVAIRYADSLEDEGSRSNNIDMAEIKPFDLNPKVLSESGNIRLRVNFSSHELIRF